MGSRDASGGIAPAQNQTKAVVLMVSASVCYAAMGGFVKHGASTLSVGTLVAGRSAIIVAVAGALVAARGKPWRIRGKRWMWLRNLTGFVAMGCYYGAIALVPLANAVTLQFVSPLFVALWSALLLGERVTTRTIACTLTALGGAALVVSPDASGFNPWALLALASAIISGVAYVAVRRLRETDEPDTIVFHFGVFSLVAALPWALWPGQANASFELAEALTLLGVGASAFGGQLFMTSAYRYAEAAFASAFSYTTVVFSAVLGWIAFGEEPTLLAAFGGFLIIAAGVALTLQRKPQITDEERPAGRR